MRKHYKFLLLASLALQGGVTTLAQTQTAISNNAVSYQKNTTAYMCQLNLGGQPKLWSKAGWTDVITMYFGGWKYQSDSDLASVYGKHITPNYGNNSFDDKGNAKTITDSWESAGEDDHYFDGYEEFAQKSAYFTGEYNIKSFGKGDNARCEFLENGIAGKYIHTLPNKEFRNGNPFTVPCFGTFMKFEPDQNGTLVVYVLQNGIIDLNGRDESLGTNVNMGFKLKASWRPTYITDELGNLLLDEQTKDDGGVKAETNHTIYIGITKNGEKLTGDLSYNNTLYSDDEKYVPQLADIINTTFFSESSSLSERVQNNLLDYWGKSGSAMNVIPPKDSEDGWINIYKSFVKYTFKVKAGKSYYVFNNSSKLGFCGYEFAPDTENKKEALTINEDGTYKIGEQEGEGDIPAGTYESVTINRTFKQGWNAICLPFSVTESKMRTAFSSNGNAEDYELVTYSGCTKGEIPTTKEGLTAYFFRHAYQDIIAGFPYMIYIPSTNAAAYKNQSITFSNITIEDNVEMATFSKSDDYIPDYTSKLYNSAPEDAYQFKGSFIPTDVPAGSYAVYGIGSNSKDPTSTGIRYVESETRMNGLRSFLYPKYLDENSDAKAVARIVGTNFSDVIDDSMWDDATVINDLMEEMGFFDQRENVYSITGQIVRQNTTSLVGLPKGVYIVKGKKYFVK